MTRRHSRPELSRRRKFRPGRIGRAYCERNRSSGHCDASTVFRNKTLTAVRVLAQARQRGDAKYIAFVSVAGLRAPTKARPSDSRCLKNPDSCQGFRASTKARPRSLQRERTPNFKVEGRLQPAAIITREYRHYRYSRSAKFQHVHRAYAAFLVAILAHPAARSQFRVDYREFHHPWPRARTPWNSRGNVRKPRRPTCSG